MYDRLYPVSGQMAQTVQPNPKCEGCLQYEPQRSLTGACSIGLRPWTCGEGLDPATGYAPLVLHAGPTLPSDASPSPAQVGVPGQDGEPVPIVEVVLGEEHAHMVKSIVQDLEERAHYGCALHSGRCASHGQTNQFVPVYDAVCICSQVTDVHVVKSLRTQLSNRARTTLSDVELLDFVGEVRKGSSAWDIRQKQLKQRAAKPTPVARQAATKNKFQTHYGPGAPIANAESDDPDLKKNPTHKGA